MGPADRAHQTPWVPIVLAAKVLADASYGVLLTAEQLSKHRALRFSCLLTAAVSAGSVPLVLREAREAIAELR